MLPTMSPMQFSPIIELFIDTIVALNRKKEITTQANLHVFV
jgi:hypothetical protein